MRQVYLGLANETGNPHVAYVDFFNNQISLSTATLQVRAVFWNHKPAVGPRLFEPGMFIRVRVPTSPAFKALLVSQEAIGTDQNLKYVDVLERNRHGRDARSSFWEGSRTDCKSSRAAWRRGSAW